MIAGCCENCCHCIENYKKYKYYCMKWKKETNYCNICYEFCHY